MLSSEKIKQIITNFNDINKEKNIEIINKIILPQNYTNNDQLCTNWNNLSDIELNKLNLKKDISRIENACYPVNDMDLQCIEEQNENYYLKECNNNIPFEYEVKLEDIDIDKIIQDRSIDYLNEFNKMEILNKEVVDLINKIQNENNKNEDIKLNKTNNEKVKKAIHTTNKEKNNTYYNKYNDFMLDNLTLNETQANNIKLNYEVDRYTRILGLLLSFIILFGLFSGLIKFSVFLSVVIFILIIILLIIVYLIIFKNKSILKKFIPPLP